MADRHGFFPKCLASLARGHVLAVMLLLSVPFGMALGDSVVEPTREQRIKAAFLYNFAKFIEWPDTRGQEREVFSLCLLGDSDLQFAADTIRGKSVHGKVLLVKTIQDEFVVAECEMVYVGVPYAERIGDLAELWQAHDVLTVAESPEFAIAGGAIGFFIEDDQLRFIINERAAIRHRLAISSRLLRIAKRVVR